MNCSEGWCNVGDHCTPCPIGFNQSQPGHTSCQKCPLGTFAKWEPLCLFSIPYKHFYNLFLSSVTGLKFCYSCPEGTHNNATGTSMCELCQPGYNASRPGSVNCKLCPQGTVCGYVCTYVVCVCISDSHFPIPAPVGAKLVCLVGEVL